MTTATELTFNGSIQIQFVSSKTYCIQINMQGQIKKPTGHTQTKKKKKNKWSDNNSNTLDQQSKPQKESEASSGTKKVEEKGNNLQQFDLKLDCETKKLSEMSKTYHIEMNVELGSGFASVVYLGQNIHNHEIVCVKVIDCIALGSGLARQALNRQIKYLKQFDCDQIVKLIDVYTSPSFCYLIMEYCGGGDLFKFLMKAEGFHPLFVRERIEQICLGLIELKKKELIHRDLKTENIFLNKMFKAKIGDLGFCVTQKEENKIDNVGSPIYMSPEVLKGGVHTFESDVYGLGVIWYELLHKKAPWQAKSESQLIQKKINEKVEFSRPDLEEDDKNFIKQCLEIETKKRPKVEQILEYCSKQNKKQLQRIKVEMEKRQKQKEEQKKQ